MPVLESSREVRFKRRQGAQEPQCGRRHPPLGRVYARVPVQAATREKDVRSEPKWKTTSAGHIILRGQAGAGGHGGFGGSIFRRDFPADVEVPKAFRHTALGGRNYEKEQIQKGYLRS